MNTDNLKQGVFDIYQALDAIQKIIPMIQNGFKTNIEGIGDVAIPADKIQPIKDQYTQLCSKVKQAAANLPTIQQLGL